MDFNSKTTNTTNTTLTNSLLLHLVISDLNSRKRIHGNPTAGTSVLPGTRSRTHQVSSLSLPAHDVPSGSRGHVAALLKRAVALIGGDAECTYNAPSKSCRRNMDSRRLQLLLPSTPASTDNDDTTMVNQAEGGGRVDGDRNTTN